MSNSTMVVILGIAASVLAMPSCSDKPAPDPAEPKGRYRIVFDHKQLFYADSINVTSGGVATFFDVVSGRQITLVGNYGISDRGEEVKP